MKYDFVSKIKPGMVIGIHTEYIKSATNLSNLFSMIGVGHRLVLCQKKRQIWNTNIQVIIIHENVIKHGFCVDNVTDLIYMERPINNLYFQQTLNQLSTTDTVIHLFTAPLTFDIFVPDRFEFDEDDMYSGLFENRASQNTREIIMGLYSGMVLI